MIDAMIYAIIIDAVIYAIHVVMSSYTIVLCYKSSSWYIQYISTLLLESSSYAVDSY